MEHAQTLAMLLRYTQMYDNHVVGRLCHRGLEQAV